MLPMKKLLSIIFLLFCLTNIKASNFYWVGGTGNWSDYSNHWATTPGGSTFRNSVPGATDDVYFGNSSFTTSSDVLTIDIDAMCQSFFFDSNNNPEIKCDTNSRSLLVNGHLIISQQFNFSFDGKIIFQTISDVLTSGTTLHCSLENHQNGASINLNDSITTTSDIIIGNNVNFYSNGHNMNIRSFLLPDDNTINDVNFSTSEVYIHGQFAADWDGTGNYWFESTTFHFSGSGSFSCRNHNSTNKKNNH